MRDTSHLAEQPGRIQEGQTGTTVQLARQAPAKRAARTTPKGHREPDRGNLAGLLGFTLLDLEQLSQGPRVGSGKRFRSR
jgi:hypothetical protein